MKISFEDWFLKTRGLHVVFPQNEATEETTSTEEHETENSEDTEDDK